MNLISGFEQNLIDGVNTLSPDKVIETIISKIFFYGDRVYKIYKYEKFFFGDFSSFEFRTDFYKEDFYWDNLMAPQVYLKLHGVKKVNNGYQIADLLSAEDFFIEMKKFDDNKNLTNLLLEKNINENDVAKIVSEMAVRLKRLTQDKKHKYANLFGRKLFDIHQEDLESDRNLLYMIPSCVSKIKTDEIINAAKEASVKSSYFQNHDKSELSLLIDNHADNIVFMGKEVGFIDVLPPKESWRVGDINFNVCRLGTDVSVLHSEEMGNMVYKSYEKFAGPIPAEAKAIFEIRSALIQAWCFYSANKSEIAGNYIKFAGNRASFLKKTAYSVL